jgi:S1-C subfamily serine protease
VTRRLASRVVLSVLTVVAAASLGAAASGAALFVHYRGRLQDVQVRVDRFIGGFEDRRRDALGAIQEERDRARAQIASELAALEETMVLSEARRDALLTKIRRSLYVVETQDGSGQPVVGAASVIGAEPDRSYLLTAFSVVRAATTGPGPAIFVREGLPIPATLWTWDETHDLALLVVDQGRLPELARAPAGRPLDRGQQVFVAVWGKDDVVLAPGFVIDAFESYIHHGAPAAGRFAGSPLLNARGEVVGMASPVYAPLGFTSAQASFAPSIGIACEEVLHCPPGQ